MALNTAIRHLQRGDWQKAHAIVQNDNTDMGCWAHGIVHLLEGDIGNARYWFRRAGRPFPRDREASAEIDALATMLKQRTSTAASARVPGPPRTDDDERAAPGRPRAMATDSPHGTKQQAAATAPPSKKQQR
jgi:hypothetical protein